MQKEEGLQGLSVVAQQPMNLVPLVHAKNLLSLGQIGWNDDEEGEGEEEEGEEKEEKEKKKKKRKRKKQEDIWRED